MADVIGRLLVYSDDDPSTPAKLIDLDRARLFGFKRIGDSQWQPKVVVGPSIPEHWLGKVLVKPHNGPWVLLGRAGLGLQVGERFTYRNVDEREAAEFALSRGYVPAELRKFVADRCLGDTPNDNDGDEVEIKKSLRLQAEKDAAAAADFDRQLVELDRPGVAPLAVQTDQELPATAAGEHGEGDAIPKLPARCYLSLKAMLLQNAVSADKSMTAVQIARKAEGKYANPESFKRPLSRLKKNGYTDSKKGTGGGCWLTVKGIDVAKKL